MKVKALLFSEIEIGNKVQIKKLISSDMIRAFAEMTGDHHPLHTDANYAKDNGFDNIIAHGLLISSLCSTIVGMHLPGEESLMLESNFKYLRPVYAENEIHIEAEVTNKDSRFSTIELKLIVVDSNKKKLVKGKFLVKVRA